MVDFLKKIAPQPPRDIELMLQTLNNAILMQHARGNITDEEILKFIDLVSSSIKLRAALMYL